MSASVEQQLREYFTMVDRMQGTVDIDATQQTPATPTLRLIHTDDNLEEAMLAPNKDQRKSHSRRWLVAAAAVAVLVLVGGLIVAANRDSDNEPADQPVTVPTAVVGVDGETAPLPDVDPSLVGSRTGGSAIFPETGNGGYDVSVYDWDLALSDDLIAVSGTATITATATQDLQQFSFDARGLEIGSLTVDGVPAEYAVRGQKLIITTSEPIQTGSEFVVDVMYDAEPVANPGPLASNRWKAVPAEHMLLGGWGDAAGWTPIDEDWITPRSRFIMRLDVPDGFTATAGGIPTQDDASGDVVWDSGIGVRMPAFAVARFDTNVIDWQVPVEVSFEQGLNGRETLEGNLVDALTFLESQYGPFPYERLGISVMNSPGVVGQAAWNTPTRYVMEGVPSEVQLLNELSWQWAGYAVAEADEREVWLFRGLADYMEALWVERMRDDIDADATTSQLTIRMPAETRTLDSFGSLADFQDETIQGRAALFLHALRLQIGDDAFSTTLREFIQQNLHTDVVVDDLRAVAEEVSGQDLDEFFTAWISETEVPELPEPAQP